MASRSAQSAAAAAWVTTGLLLEFSHQILDGTLNGSPLQRSRMSVEPPSTPSWFPAPAEQNVCRTPSTPSWFPAPAEPNVCRTRALDPFRVRVVLCDLIAHAALRQWCPIPPRRHTTGTVLVMGHKCNHEPATP